MPTNQKTLTDSDVRQYRYDVFLSHHSSDKPLVERIGARLEDEAGLKPFLDKWHLVPGEPWEEELEEALNKSATCAVFLGPSGLGAWHNEEMRAALDERVRNKAFRVVPILLPGAEPKDNSTLPRFLRRLTWVDFRAGLDDQEAFHRLVAGIKGRPPGRQPSSLNAASSPSQSLNRISVRLLFSALMALMRRTELWKVVAGAVLGLLLSTAFISAAIPRYKLQIESPAFRKDGIYEVPAGPVIVKWKVSKERWFREVDLSNAKANVAIKRIGDDDQKGKLFQDSPGEVKTTLKPGTYQVDIDAVEHQRSETITLKIIDQTQKIIPREEPANHNGGGTPTQKRGTINGRTAKQGKPRNIKPDPHVPVGLTIRGQVIDAQSEQPIEGVRVCFKGDCQNGTLTDGLGQFTLNSTEITEQEGKLVVTKQGYNGREPYYHVGVRGETIRLVRN